MQLILNVSDTYKIDSILTSVSTDMLEIALSVASQSLHYIQEKSNPIEIERLQSKLDDTNQIYASFFTQTNEDIQLQLKDATEKIIALEKQISTVTVVKDLETSKVIQMSEYELKSLETQFHNKFSDLEKTTLNQQELHTKEIQRITNEFETYKVTSKLQHKVETLNDMNLYTQQTEFKIQSLLQDINTSQTSYIQLKDSFDVEKLDLTHKITELEGKCYISSKKGQHGEIIIKELIEEFGLNATPTPYEKDAGDLRVTENDESGFYTNDDNMRLKIECKKKGKITKQDLTDFEQSAIRAFENKQANQALFISLDYWIPGHPTSMIIKYVDDEFGRPILPIVFLGAIRKPFQPLCKEQIEIVLNMHMQMHFQLTKFKNVAIGTELQDEELIHVRSVFEKTVEYVEDMQKNFQEQDENILRLQNTHCKMRVDMLKYYKSLQQVNNDVPWLQQPMQIRHENLLNVVFSKGDKFDWNTSLNGTQRNGLKKYFGEECVKTVHEHVSKKQK